MSVPLKKLTQIVLIVTSAQKSMFGNVF